MDAHVFRRLCDALNSRLDGARLEKIQSPASGVYFFSFYNIRGPFQLVLRAERKAPFLFVPAERLGAGGRVPPAEVMRLRKYLLGRRIAVCMADWPARRLNLLFRGFNCAGDPSYSSPRKEKRKESALNTDLPGSFSPRMAHLPATGENGPGETWLVLDLREGPRLLLGQSPDMPEPPVWPDPAQVEAMRGNQDELRQWPVMTPALRRAMPHLDSLELAALINDLAEGGGDLYLYPSAALEDKVTVSAWPLPAALRGNRAEKAFEDPLAAMNEAGMKLVMGGLAELARKRELAPLTRAGARFERILQKLDAEEERLRVMLARKQEGIMLRDNVWRLGASLKKSEVTVKTHGAPDRLIKLDPRLTVLENMEHIFHQAARGSRGLAFVAQRRAGIAAEMAAAGLGPGASLPLAPGLQTGGAESGRGVSPFAPDSPAGGGPASGIAPGAGQASTALPASSLPRGVAGFCSAHGPFILWRGKDAKGNAALIKAAAPHDVWLHVEGGPGAHVLIRRDHAAQEIPEEVWREAGLLAKEKSWRRDDSKAAIICALARHVRPVKGGEPGAARVDKVLQTLQVDVEAD